MHKLGTALIAIAFACSAFAECTVPPAPSKVPQAATATEDEMRIAMQTLKRYEKDVNAYVKCLAFEVKQGHLSSDEAARRHNIAVDRLENAATAFNEQMRIFLGH